MTLHVDLSPRIMALLAGIGSAALVAAVGALAQVLGTGQLALTSADVARILAAALAASAAAFVQSTRVAAPQIPMPTPVSVSENPSGQVHS